MFIRTDCARILVFHNGPMVDVEGCDQYVLDMRVNMFCWVLRLDSLSSLCSLSESLDLAGVS